MELHANHHHEKRSKDMVKMVEAEITESKQCKKITEASFKKL